MSHDETKKFSLGRIVPRPVPFTPSTTPVNRPMSSWPVTSPATGATSTTRTAG